MPPGGNVFHVKHSPLLRALEWIGLVPDAAMIDRMAAFVDLLTDEGLRAGVIGPNEPNRVWSRHIADSVCFAKLAVGETWLDVGSGGGLPGIPLGICRPDVEVTLLDRSGRRTDLVRRWIRALSLSNVKVVHHDVTRYTTSHDTLLFRGSLGLEDAIACTHRLAIEVGVFGLSHGSAAARAELTELPGVEVVEVPEKVLDSAATLLRIAP